MVNGMAVGFFAVVLTITFSVVRVFAVIGLLAVVLE